MDLYKDDLKNDKINHEYPQLQHVISEVLVTISKGEDKYRSRLAQKLNNPSGGSETHSHLQNLAPLLTAVLDLIRHNMFQPPGFPYFVSMRKLY